MPTATLQGPATLVRRNRILPPTDDRDRFVHSTETTPVLPEGGPPMTGWQM